jgi:outer membrane protein, adhesin transport system
VRYFASLIAFCLLPAGAGFAAQPFTIIDAINQAVQTNPGVGEAAANRRGIEAELRQNQATLLPQVHTEAKWGVDRFNIQDTNSPPPLGTPPIGNQTWLTGYTGTVVVRQLLFDGLATINQIWRQAARVDAAAYRVHERTELIALDAAEAYIDVVRYTHLVAIARENVGAHTTIFSNVQARFQGGRAGEGDTQQVQERVEAAKAALAQFQQNLDEARGAFRRAIGIEPYNLRIPGRLASLPRSKDESLAITLDHNPTIQAAQADRDAARHDFDSTAGAFVPTIALEGRAERGKNVNEIFGRQSDVSGYVTATWDIFRGGQDTWKRAEAAEQYQQQTMAHARLQRAAYESIDKAWAARTLTADRISALTRQIGADRKVIDAYQKEYELGQRSLIDLLNGQNQLFNANVSLESARSVAVFADYQLLAAMGQLLEYLKTPHPIDAEPLDAKPFGLIPTKLPPILLWVPEPGSEPLKSGNANSPYATYAKASTPGPQQQAQGAGFPQLFPSWLYAAAKPQRSAIEPQPTKESQPIDLSSPVSSYAPERQGLPAWFVWPTKVN